MPITLMFQIDTPSCYNVQMFVLSILGAVLAPAAWIELAIYGE